MINLTSLFEHVMAKSHSWKGNLHEPAMADKSYGKGN